MPRAGRIADLQRDIQQRYGVSISDQRWFAEGLPLFSELELQCLPVGVPIIVKRSMQGGADTPADKRWSESRKQDRLLKQILGSGRIRSKRGRKKSAQRTTAHQKAKHRSGLLYHETRGMMDARRSQLLEDISFGEFNEAWQGMMTDAEINTALNKEN